MALYNNILYSLATVTTILLLIFSVLLLSHKNRKNISHTILAAFLLNNALYIAGYLLQILHIFPGRERTLPPIIWIAFGYLFGPLLYLYTKSLIQTNFKFKTVYLAYFLPFIMVILGIILYRIIPFRYIYSTFLLYTIPYVIICFILILNYRNRIKEYFSSIDKLKLSWLLYVVGAFFVMWMTDITHYLLSIFSISTVQITFFFDLVSLSINFIFTIIIFYWTLNYAAFFNTMPAMETRQKYKLSRLTKKQKESYLNRLLEHFKSDKPFLNQDMTISDIATRLDVPVKYLSQVINESTGKNFYDFVNHYRIDHAKQLLSENADPPKTVLEILYESGFNSKSAFNLAFKKNTGFTPREFKKISAVSKLSQSH